MKGATVEPWPNTIKDPKIANTIKIGSNQYFFLSMIKTQNSFINNIIKIVFS